MRPKRSRFALALVWFLLVAIFPPALPGVAGDWEVYFSPRGGCTQAIVKEVGKAGASVLVQAYSFSSWPIAKALVEAHQRGVQVKVILARVRYTRNTQPSNTWPRRASLPGSTRPTILPTTKLWSLMGRP